MAPEVDDLKSELTNAVQKLAVPEDLTALMEKIQEATKRIDELKRKLYGDAPPIVS